MTDAKKDSWLTETKKDSWLTEAKKDSWLTEAKKERWLTEAIMIKSRYSLFTHKHHDRKCRENKET